MERMKLGPVCRSSFCFDEDTFEAGFSRLTLSTKESSPSTSLQPDSEGLKAMKLEDDEPTASKYLPHRIPTFIETRLERELGTLDSKKYEKVKANTTGKDGWSCLMLAAREGREGLVEALAASEADVNYLSPWGSTALIEASRVASLGCVHALIKAKADVNLVGERETALMEAVAAGDRGVVSALITAGADPSKTLKISGEKKWKVEELLKKLAI